MEAEPDDDDEAAAGGADGDLPAELAALVAAASSDQEELPDLFKNEQLYGEQAAVCVFSTAADQVGAGSFVGM
jgi:hypothetical protein